MKDCQCTQQSDDCPACTDRWNQWMTRKNQNGNGSPNSRNEIEQGKFMRPEFFFQSRSEAPKSHHIESQVQQSSMKKQARKRLPDLKITRYKTKHFIQVTCKRKV